MVVSGNTAFAILVVIGVMFLYFLPTVVAFERRHKHKGAIFVANFLFGWTVLGWGILLVWSCMNQKAELA